MNKSAKSTEGRKAANAGQLWLRLQGLVREALYETVIGAGLACVDEVLEALIEQRHASAWKTGTIAGRARRRAFSPGH